jgi:hypothetical protein
MNKVKAGFALLALLLPLLLNATSILRNDILNKAAASFIEQIGEELYAKTGIHGYVVATNEQFPEHYNLFTYAKRYDANASKPYVMLIFAPNAVITVKSQKKGRVGIIPSSKEIASMYDRGDVMDAMIGVVASVDKNKVEDKHAIGIVQGFSELADELADAKGVKLEHTIKETRQGIWVLQVIVIIGALLVLWMFFFRPLYIRIKDGKKAS